MQILSKHSNCKHVTQYVYDGAQVMFVSQPQTCELGWYHCGLEYREARFLYTFNYLIKYIYIQHTHNNMNNKFILIYSYLLFDIVYRRACVCSAFGRVLLCAICIWRKHCGKSSLWKFLFNICILFQFLENIQLLFLLSHHVVQKKWRKFWK